MKTITDKQILDSIIDQLASNDTDLNNKSHAVYEDEDKDGFGIYVRAYNDGTFYAEAAIRIGSFSKDIQFFHELQHMFKEFNAQKDWVI